MATTCGSSRLAALIVAAGVGDGAPALAQLGPVGNAIWDQASAFSSLAAHETDDELGRAVAAGDFNGDGWDDLAVGSPGEDIGALNSAGAVFIIFGGEDGLQPRASSTSGNAVEAFNQNDFENAGDAFGGGSEADDEFGSVLAAGDFDADGYDDLVIGTPRENLEAPAVADIGIVHVVYGSPAGLKASNGSFRFQVWDEDRVPSEIAVGTRYGAALAVGDFDGDAIDDLAIGIPGEHFYGDPDAPEAGAVAVFYGGEDGGLSETRRERFFEPVLDGYGGPEQNDWFGASLAAGDFDDDSYDDLAIGVPAEFALAQGSTAQGAEPRGGVVIARGSAGGLDPTDELLALAAVQSIEAPLASTDLDADGIDDLAICIYYEFSGTPWRLVPYFGVAGDALETSSGLTMPFNDCFSIASGALDGDGRGKLVIGGPHQGALEYGVIFGRQDFEWTLRRQGFDGLVDSTEAVDLFGYAVAIGEFGLGTGLDLAAGVPFEDTLDKTDNGAFHVIYNRILFGDGFETGVVDRWSSNVGGDPGPG